MSDTERLCPACGAPLVGQPGGEFCRRCATPVPDTADAPTVDLEEIDPGSAGDGTSPESRDPLLGVRLDHYRIERLLGRGAMARVYLAHDLRLERPCAIKVLDAHGDRCQDEIYETMMAEARAAAALNHPNIVTIHTVGSEGGLHFIEMEYVAGESLARLARSTSPLEVAEATRLMVDASAALAAAHRAGFVHRDVKPGNVLVTGTGVAKLGDFGLATRTTRTGGGLGPLAGTPHFMAPELFEGTVADALSDVYAMGATYHALLTGMPPYVGMTVSELARAHARAGIPDIAEIRPSVPAEAVDLAQRCLAKRPSERPASGEELHQELRAVYGSIRSLDSLLREALAGLDVRVDAAGEGHAVVVGLERGRTQGVHVEAVRDETTGQHLVRLFSVCGPTTDRYYRLALELNATLPHGSIAIEEFEGKPHFVMVRTFLRATCDPDEIRHSIVDIATHADEIERRLTGGDRH